MAVVAGAFKWLIVHHVFLKSYGIISRKTNTIIKFMCVGAMDGRCQIDIASVVSAHIVFYILHQGLTISLLAVIFINHQILKGIIKAGVRIVR